MVRCSGREGRGKRVHQNEESGWGKVAQRVAPSDEVKAPLEEAKAPSEEARAPSEELLTKAEKPHFL
jgi:hypothetical protein